MNLSRKDIKKFQKTVYSYYKDQKRELPWRNTWNPYEILVSEVMLQQTQIVRVLEKYPLFLAKFPNIETLANASKSELLAIWSGLGYNRRALFLHKTAKEIRDQFNCEVPTTVVTLETLPGIGAYTAGAVATFATNKPYIFVETNIRSAVLHEILNDMKNVSDRKILAVLEQMVDTNSPREWYYALMDYGAYIKKTFGNPNNRSKTYTKQSKFEGSKRQLRGLILRLLTDSNLVSLEQIKAEMDFSEEEVIAVIHNMQQEGFIVYRPNTETVQIAG